MKSGVQCREKVLEERFEKCFHHSGTIGRLISAFQSGVWTDQLISADRSAIGMTVRESDGRE